MADDARRNLLMLALPFGLEGQVAGPNQTVSEKVLLHDRLELQLIFIALLARDHADPRPAGFGVKCDSQAALSGRTQLVFELRRKALEGEVAVGLVNSPDRPRT
jgi:hypothetical protein